MDLWKCNRMKIKWLKTWLKVCSKHHKSSRWRAAHAVDTTIQLKQYENCSCMHSFYHVCAAFNSLNVCMLILLTMDIVSLSIISSKYVI